MAKVWVYNAGMAEWEAMSVPVHDHNDLYYTKQEVEDRFLDATEAGGLFAPLDHTHDARYLSPDEILAGPNVAVTRNADGTVTISAIDRDTDEVGIGHIPPTSAPDPRELYVDTQAEGTFALLSPTAVEPGPGTGTGVSDHGDLTGLGTDDHLQYLTVERADGHYLRKDGTATVTVAPTDPGHLANKKYVDEAVADRIIVSDDPASGLRPFGTVWIEY